MTGRRDWFTTFTDIAPLPVYLGDDSVVHATGVGTINVTMHLPNGDTISSFNEVLFIPSFSKNLFSSGKAIKSGAVAVQENNHYNFHHKSTHALLAAAVYSNGLYILQCTPVIPLHANASRIPTSLMLWHHRLGHIGYDRLRLLLRQGAIAFKEKHLDFCEGCTKGNLKRSNVGRNNCTSC
jgi:hypothetical protein